MSPPFVILKEDDDESRVEPQQEKQEARPTYSSWEICKENIQPLTQGRKIDTLTKALSLVSSRKTRQELFEARKE